MNVGLSEAGLEVQLLERANKCIPQESPEEYIKN
jgi:hypothetical protein